VHGAEGDIEDVRRQVGRLGHEAMYDLGPDLEELAPVEPQQDEDVGAQVTGVRQLTAFALLPAVILPGRRR
jgi:hypothetical protein